MRKQDDRNFSKIYSLLLLLLVLSLLARYVGYCFLKKCRLTCLGYFQLPNFESAKIGRLPVSFTVDTSRPSSNTITLNTGNYGRKKQALAFVTIATKW